MRGTVLIAMLNWPIGKEQYKDETSREHASGRKRNYGAGRSLIGKVRRGNGDKYTWLIRSATLVHCHQLEPITGVRACMLVAFIPEKRTLFLHCILIFMSLILQRTL